MRRYLMLILFAISICGQTQPISSNITTKKDSIIYSFIKISKDAMKVGNCNEAINSISKAILIDSTYYELYYIRGFYYDFKGCFDSTTFSNLINDFYKCIILKKTAKIFPDTTLTNSILNMDDLSPHTENLDEIVDFFISSALLRGVSIYLKSNGRDNIKYCNEWQIAYKDGIKDINKLIDKFCK